MCISMRGRRATFMSRQTVLAGCGQKPTARTAARNSRGRQGFEGRELFAWTAFIRARRGADR